MFTRTLVLACTFLIVTAAHATLAAQVGVDLSGRLLNSLSSDPIAGATVQIDELGRTATSAVDGTFTFTDVAPGAYHLSVYSQGFSTRRTEITVSSAATPQMDIAVDPELHFEEVTTVTGQERSQFDVFQPTAVLAGQELAKQLEMSLGATLENQPGVAARSFGPAPARPVIRGLDGDRVQILQDGQRIGDLSSQSGDHGVNVNPASASRIEVVRGPATLLYGANAVGGLVNVITEDIPTRPVLGTTGTLNVDFGSAATETGTAADIRAGNGTFAFHAGGGGRRSGDVTTPDGALDNSQSRNGFGTVGLSWTGAQRYFGGSYGYDDTKYGIPIVEEGQVQLTPRRHAFGLRTGAQGLTGAFDAYRATVAVRRYKHDELVGDDVGTAFKNNTQDIEFMGSHRALARMKGTVGARVLSRAFGASGAEALSPDVDQREIAVFFYEELTWPHVRFQFGGRVDHTQYSPDGENVRSFTSGSGSVGLLFTPAATNERLTLAVSVARAARNPALDELFYFGPHPGNFAFEIGNPDLRPEYAMGFDVSTRWRGARASGEVTYFRNDIQDFVFRSPLTIQGLARRMPEFAARFPGRALDIDEADEFVIVEHIGADSVLQGIEAHGDVGLTSQLFAEFGLDYVHATLKDTNDPLPRIPPLRAQFGLRYRYNAFQAGGTVTATATQDRVLGEETPTDGYQLLRLFASYAVVSGDVLHTLTARVDNVTDTFYRNHLSLIKDLTPETGRNIKLLYSIGF
ncbi:MAG: TonB-dependent receptor [Acidobacteria bacterium]|nr:TonB-dependent receptor [Acidobacteriota bacterium]